MYSASPHSPQQLIRLFEIYFKQFHVINYIRDNVWAVKQTGLLDTFMKSYALNKRDMFQFIMHLKLNRFKSLD